MLIAGRMVNVSCVFLDGAAVPREVGGASRREQWHRINNASNKTPKPVRKRVVELAIK